MNKTIKNKLEELIGKNVLLGRPEYGFSIIYRESWPEPPSEKIIRIENDECVIIQSFNAEYIIPLDFICLITIYK
jgi:hypothetical protein